MSLSAKSTIQEVFDFIRTEDHDVQVLPVTISKPDEEWARLMIIIQGKPKTAHHIMANLMASVQEMFDLAEQHAATALVDSTGEKLTDDVKLEIVS